MTTAALPLTVRVAGPQDADMCGRIFFDAFRSIAERHNFPTEPGSRAFTSFHAERTLSDDGFHVTAAEIDGAVVGAAFMDERGPIAGIGPVVVDPSLQDAGVGRAMMERLLGRCAERGVAGVRLLQTAYHYRSLSLYAKLGFVVREPVSVFNGSLDATTPPHVDVRAALPDDAPACNAVCRGVHGHDRAAELADAIEAGSAFVALSEGVVTGYATGFGYGWHAVARGDDELKALLVGAPEFMGLGVLVPSRNTELVLWCLASGLRVVQQSTLMTIGLYNEPAGAWLPSIAY